MKRKHQFTLLLIIFMQFVIAQTYEWKKIESNFYQTTISNKSQELIQNQDSLKLTVFAFDRNDVINVSDSTALIFPPIKITFKNLKEQLSFKNLPALIKESEFLFKFETPQKKVYEYEFYLVDKISKSQLNDLKKYLSETVNIISLKYISKNDAKLQASKLLGIESKDLFEGDIFPASIIIKTNEKIDFKNIESKFKKS